MTKAEIISNGICTSGVLANVQAFTPVVGTLGTMYDVYVVAVDGSGGQSAIYQTTFIEQQNGDGEPPIS